MSFHGMKMMELALSALNILDDQTPFILLKNHGFVAMGEDIDTTAKRVLLYYGKLIDLLQDMACVK